MKTVAPIYQTLPSELDAMKPFFPTREPRLAGRRRIPVSEPNISAREIRYVTHAISSSWISSTGDYVKRFEKLFAQIVSKTKFAISVNSGTSALHVALAALGVGPGDEVILPTFTMIATINAVAYCGATPVVIDADLTTWNMDASDIEKHITDRTKAIIAVHTYGAPADMDTIMHIARKHELWVVEDAAEAHGATYHGKPVGGIGDVGAFSLYANKIITTGEGGMVVTNNEEIADRLRLLHNNAFTQEMHFWHTMIGFGYRMTNLQAAVGTAQVERFTKLLSIKRTNARLYVQLLSDIQGVTLPYEAPATQHSYWMFGILINKKRFGMDKNHLRILLAARGIETRPFFIPLHVQPPYWHLFKNVRYPVSEQLCRDGLYLPSSTTLTKKDIAYIAGCIRELSRVH
ncbi:MAG TPA: DegT/DnrJ/EryC1/StrS family aminotransferase [Patescibacteria group bacterium]|nr:DegT/DnrJ/EryC1/StrS family aminotransferase [Patescibacteria group bacterium]